MKNKRFLVILVALVIFALAAILTACTSATDGNYIQNGSFEGERSELDVPNGWEQEKETLADGATNESTITNVSVFAENSNEYNQYNPILGKTQIKFENKTATYTVLKQTVKLERGKVYKISAWMHLSANLTATSGVTSHAGAHVGFLEDKDFNKIKEVSANGGWKEYVAYFTPATGNALTLVVGVGDATSGLTKGTAYIDNVTIEVVEPNAVPTGETTYTVKYNDTLDYNNSGSITFTVLLTVFSVIACLLAYVLIRKNITRKNDGVGANGNGGTPVAVKQKISVKTVIKSPILAFIAVILGAFLVRLLFVLTIQSGYGESVNTLKAIANAVVNMGGPPKFFASYKGAGVDTPYGALYVLGAIGGLGQALGITATEGMNILVRIPMVIADIVTCYLVFTLASKYYSTKIAVIFAGLFAVLPFVFVASSVWGMTVTMAIPFLVGAFISALNKKYVLTTALYTLSLTFSYYAVFLAPLFIAYFIKYFAMENTKGRVQIGVSNLVSVLLFFILAIPFTLNHASEGSIFYVAVSMWNSFGEVIYLTENVFGFYTMIGMTNATAVEAMIILQAIFTVIVIGTAIYLYIVSGSRLNLILTSAWVFIFLSIIGSQSTLPLFALGLMLLFLYLLMSGERRVFKLFSVFSATLFLNIAMLIGRSGYIGGSPNATYTAFQTADAFNIVVALINVCCVAYFTYVTLRITVYGDEREIIPLTESWFKEQSASFREKRAKLGLMFSKKK